jgi:hypothetical protein
MPDFTELINSITSTIPDLVDAFWRGGQYTLALFLLLGIIYFLRRYL